MFNRIVLKYVLRRLDSILQRPGGIYASLI